ncbi:putative quinol monooxygenase [Portibacter lacus]|uniref:Antibiotic biosynthesis monooxygenase n=1 Tax=Portibacter lacus TaxID=1099794 RepID=A0AA37SPE2_9BACT|nr:antibiotic biosynthesis monooxygenase family protein [Portibacter lacus]GLR17017.1 antibiotic biosynthesis monooxygenase [Portibacter lacus]
MINRIVRLSFHPDKKADFIQVFEKHQQAMPLLFPSCKSLRLLEDLHHNDVFFTYSTWDSEDVLEDYRASAYFKEIWGTVKPWFNERAQAWSLGEIPV